MKQEDLDQILLKDRNITPAESFSTNVMARSEKEAAPKLSNPFFWLYLVLLFALSIPAMLFFPADAFVRTMTVLASDFGSWLLAFPKLVFQQEFLAVSTSLLGTWFLVWISLRLAGAGRQILALLSLKQR
jgi:hypothetical protein